MAEKQTFTRRSMDRLTRSVIGGLLTGLIIQSVAGLIYAGRLDERVSNIEKHIDSTLNQENRILTNSIAIMNLSGQHELILNSLKDIKKLQRRFEIKIGRSHP